MAHAPLAIVYSVPLLVLWGHATNAWWTFRMPVWVFLAIPVLDWVVRPTVEPRTVEREPAADAWFSPLWLWVPLQAALVWCGLRAVAPSGAASSSLWLTLQVAVAVGLLSGMYGVPVVHELLHRRGAIDRACAEVLLSLISYTHFTIEHVDGHHRRVATPADPATARLGESVYRFWVRTVVGSLASAWRTETGRLTAAGHAPLGPRNRMLRYAVVQVTLSAVVQQTFGWAALAFLGVQGLVALSILEVLNYVGHYGLERREIAPGRYEPVTPAHAWNSSHRASNLFLLNVARHADHHCLNERRYWELQHRDEAPQLPTGYVGMFVLALFPLLWRSTMDPRVEWWRARRASQVEVPA